MTSFILRPLLVKTFRTLAYFRASNTRFFILQNRMFSGNEREKQLDRVKNIDARESNDLELDEINELNEQFEEIFEKIKEKDDGSILGPQRIRVRDKKLDISQMKDENDSLSKPINNWRKIIYSEGELDKSDLSRPPSKSNPHPFDPSMILPPTHSLSIAAYVNHLPVLQKLLDLGVDLLDIDTNTKIGRELVKLDWEKDIRPKLSWLAGEVGVELDTLGSYLTRNPYFLIQDLDNMKVRIKYLRSKKFDSLQIAKIVVENRYWLNMDIKAIDSRLGYMQRQFKLSGDEVRRLIVKEPRVIQFGLGPIQRLILLFNKEWRLSEQQLKKILMIDPRIFMMDPIPLTNTYNYLTKVMKLPNEQILDFPLALRCPIAMIRRRHEFLKRLKKDQYHPEQPDFISLEMLLHPSDKYFSEKLARVFVSDYNNFLKIL